MVKEKLKLKRESTLAFDLITTLKQSPISDTLQQYYPLATQQLYNQLIALDTSKEANHIIQLLQLIELNKAACANFEHIPAKEREDINRFWTDKIAYLQKLNKIEAKSNITITCALDGYTLEITHALITRLHAFIQNNDSKSKEPALSQATNLSFSTFFYSFNERGSLVEECQIARALKILCEQVQHEIGSPETMPKGLIINLVAHLYAALRSCEQIKCTNYQSKLSTYIENEINQIKQRFPELDEVGEALQKAVAHCHFKK